MLKAAGETGLLMKKMYSRGQVRYISLLLTSIDTR